MDVGKLNKRISLECRRDVADIYNFDVKDYTSEVDENGFIDDGWVEIGVIFCTVTNVEGKELLDNNDQLSTNVYKRFKFRYKKYLDETIYFDATHDFRIVYGNSIWNITSINDIKDRHEYIEILATREESKHRRHHNEN